MAKLQSMFDAETIEPSTQYQPLPKGKYLCVATYSEIKPTKSGNGEYLSITFEVVEGEFKGKKVFERLNIRNQNKVAEDIAHRTLSSICRAVGVTKLEDSEQLHDKEIVLDVVIEEGDGKYAAQNKVKAYEAAYMHAPAQSAPKTTAAPRAQAPAPQAISNKPAWKR